MRPPGPLFRSITRYIGCRGQNYSTGTRGPSLKNKFPQVSSISRLLFNRPVDRSRSISTVDKDSPSWECGRYRQSIRIHILENTVDIASTVDFSQKSVEIDRRCGFIPKKIGWFLEKSGKKGPLTYGPIWSHKWWEMVPDTNLQKSHGPMCGQKWSQQLSKCRYLSTDLSTRSIDHGLYRRLIRIHLLENTVDIDGRCRFTYGELRSIVDGRLKIEIILWLISSTTLVKISRLVWCTPWDSSGSAGLPPSSFSSFGFGTNSASPPPPLQWISSLPWVATVQIAP